MRIESEALVFETTGRKEYANNQIVGIDNAGRVFEGYDGGFADGDDNLNDDEKKELALHMIDRWKSFGGIK